MRIDTFRCDVCGEIKGENNHWFRIDTAEPGLVLKAWGVMPSSPTTVDLCSDQCVTKIVQKWLTAEAKASSGRGYGHGHAGMLMSMEGRRAS